MHKLTSIAIITIGLLSSTAIVVTGSPAIAKSFMKSVSHSVSKASHSVSKATKTVTKGASSAAKTVSKGASSAEKTVAKGATKAANTTMKKSGVETAVTTTTKTIVKAAEHPEETAKGLQKDAVGLEKDAKTDATDLAHGNVKKLMTDTAHQENAIDAGISKGTGVSVDTLKTVNAIEGGAMEKAAVQAAEHPEATLKSIEKDAKGVEHAVRTDAADVASGNAAKLLRDTTNQENSVIATAIKTEVQLTGMPVPKGILNAGISFDTTLNSMMTGQGAAAIIEALAHGKTDAALGMATKDMSTLQGNDLMNATNHEISKDTGLSTALLNTTEQVALAFAGGGEGAVASDAAKVVAKESVEAATKDAVAAGVQAGTEAAAKKTAEAAAQQTVEAGAKAGAEDVAKSAATTAAKDSAKEATSVGAKEVTSAGAKEAAEVIPQGIVKERVAFFEGLAKTGTQDAAKDAAKSGAKAATEDAAKAGAKAAVEDAAKAGTVDATKAAAKGGFDDAVKSRLTAAAEAAAKDAVEKGFSGAALEQIVRLAVADAGDAVVEDTGKLASYAVKSRWQTADKFMETVAEDAAMAGTKAARGAVEKEGLAAAAKVGAKEAGEYASRMMDDSRFVDEVAARASKKIDIAFVANSLAKHATEIATEKAQEKVLEKAQEKAMEATEKAIEPKKDDKTANATPPAQQ